MQLKEQTLFHDRYRLIRLLGRGGFSEVWQAEDSRTNLIVALKIYAPGTGLDEDGVKLFSKEFSLVFNFTHGNLLRPSHFDIYERKPYLIMPFCEHGSAIKLCGNISEENAWKFLRDVASGLAYLHSQEPPVIHQDIKPDNVLIDSGGHFLITDFGISSKARSTLRKSQVAAKAEESNKTPAYTSPERYSKDNIPIKASDVWALGATMFELLTGDVPFGDLGGLVQKGGAEIPNISGNYSSELKKIVEECLLPQTWDRPKAEKVVEQAEQHIYGKKQKPDKKQEQVKKQEPVKKTEPVKKQEPVRNEREKNSGKTKEFKESTPWAMIITIIATVVVVAVAVIWMLNASESGRKNRLEEFRSYSDRGNAFYEEGSYKDALIMFDSAMTIAQTGEIENAYTTPLSNRRNELKNKIDATFNDLVEKARRLEEKDDKISSIQAIANLEEALKLKDSPQVSSRLTNLRNRLKAYE